MSDKSREMAWLQRERKRLQAEFPGKWLAIDGERVVGIGDDLSEARAHASARGVQDPLFIATRERGLEKVLMIRRRVRR
jgi:hypothetical protein